MVEHFAKHIPRQPKVSRQKPVAERNADALVLDNEPPWRSAVGNAAEHEVLVCKAKAGME
jgi:hypothetical protein